MLKPITHLELGISKDLERGRTGLQALEALASQFIAGCSEDTIRQVALDLREVDEDLMNSANAAFVNVLLTAFYEVQGKQGTKPRTESAAQKALRCLLDDVDNLPLHAHKRKVVREWIESAMASLSFPSELGPEDSGA